MTAEERKTSDEGSEATESLPATPPPQDPIEDTNPGHNLQQKDSYAGRPDQDIKKTTGAGAGGATEWGGGNKNHPSRIAGKPPGG